MDFSNVYMQAVELDFLVPVYMMNIHILLSDDCVVMLFFTTQTAVTLKSATVVLHIQIHLVSGKSSDI